MKPFQIPTFTKKSTDRNDNVNEIWKDYVKRIHSGISNVKKVKKEKHFEDFLITKEKGKSFLSN